MNAQRDADRSSRRAQPVANRARTPRTVLAALERRIARRLRGGAPTRDHWIRQTMHESVDNYVRALPPESREALEISGRFYGEYPWRSYEHWDYPQFDLCDPGRTARSFDVVICDQVLEHVIDPITAVRTLFDLCSPGGHVIVGVPFLVRIHRAPGDYWRFTPDGLRILLEYAGFDVSFVEGWGNRRCVKANFLVWARKPRWFPDVNEPDFPVNVWAFARKPRQTT